MEERFSHSTLGQRNLSSENHWKELDPAEYRITKPTVICLSGNSSTTPDQTNGLCRICESLLGMNAYGENGEVTETLYDQVDIVGMVYGSDHKRGAGSLSEEETTQFVDNLFMPLCVNENGEFLSVEEIQKNFSLVTFFTFCQGANSCYYLMQELQKNLLAGGFSREQTQQMFSQMFQVSYAPNIIKNASFVPSVNMISGGDHFRFDTVKGFNERTKTLREKFAEVTPYEVKQLNPEEMQENPNMVAYTQSENGAIKITQVEAIDEFGRVTKYSKPAESIDIYTSRLLGDYMPPLDEHNVDVISRNREWQISKFEQLGGELVPYGENADMASQVMAYALASSVANSIQNSQTEELVPKLPISTLMTELNLIVNPQTPIPESPNLEQ